MENIMKRPV